MIKIAPAHNVFRQAILPALALTAAFLLSPTASLAQQATANQIQACESLRQLRNLTITEAGMRDNDQSDSAYCYVRGIISPAIHFHAQLPLPENFNGRFLQWGDGGKDGDLDFANHRVAEGYAVTNSNTGHDSGTEPGSAFGYNNRQAEIDFGYRAVHLTVMAGKTLVNNYYNRAPDYSYFEGCSTGGRQGLMEAQRYPNDFDGIVAGAPVNYYQAMNAAGTWNLQRMFKDNFAGNLAIDSNGDGQRDSVELVRILNDAVLQKCDANDGIRDGVLNNPLSCDFDPRVDLADHMCPSSGNGAVCFNDAQIQTIADFYSGPYDSNGTVIYPGRTKGSELDWIGLFVPSASNGMAPSMLRGPAGDHVNYLFYEEDPGVTIPNLNDPNYTPRRDGMNPEFHWLDFSVDDFTSGQAELMSSIMDATDPDLSSFLESRDGKLIIYHGMGDALSVATATVNYFNDMVDTTFAGSFSDANDSSRLFLAPGMGHCGGGPGPNNWDKLAPLVDWVENGVAPESLTATHSTDGSVDNERLLCTFPQQARYTGPTGGENDSDNWVAENFSCQ
ncbi:MAG: tannase/feruloyl esterase family alpha/beta hydrolase [Gammaproteobacteria bacterium]|jgi:feruloyl esterase|nr:tannase/feruloyl esterase family alpha/beta hydrolase [Gammaproteobacteria bacterium]